MKILIPAIAALALLWTPNADAQAVVRQTTTTTSAPLEIAGTVTDWTPEAVTIREKDVVQPVRFIFGRRMEYVDDAGHPVARAVIPRGVAVTIRYTREGDRMLADRVIVQQSAVRAPAVTTQTTTTTTTTVVTGPEAKEIQALRARIAREERELAEHPDRANLADELDRDRAKLEHKERELHEHR